MRVHVRINPRDDAERVVLFDCTATDTTKETLLHATAEAQDSDLGRWLREIRKSTLRSLMVAEKLTNSMSTGTSRVQIHGSAILWKA